MSCMSDIPCFPRHPGSPAVHTDVIPNLTQDQRLLWKQCSGLLHGCLSHWSLVLPHWNTEQSLLDTFLHKNQNRFRNDKGFKSLKLIRKCIRRLDEVDPGKILGDFRGLIPLAGDIHSREGSQLYFPGRGVLSHALERLEASFWLLRQCVGYCSFSGDLQLKRICLGHFWNVALNQMSVISRICSLAQTLMFLINYAFEALSPLEPSLNPSLPLPPPCKEVNPQDLLPTTNLVQRLEQGKLRAILEGEISFADLPTRLKSPTTIIPPQKKKTEERGEKNNITKNDDDKGMQKPPSRTSVAGLGEVIPRNGHQKKPLKKKIKKNTSEDIRVTPETVIPPADEDPLPCSKRRWKLLCDKIDALPSCEAVLEFLEEENALRKKSRKDALTKKLDQGQWKDLKTVTATDLKNLKKKVKLKRVKEQLKLWVLFPERKGMAPNHWKNVVLRLS